MPSDEIARHAASRGHWPGKTHDEIAAIVDDVRNSWNNKYTAPNGEVIYRKGDIILIENPARGHGTVFPPSVSALEYFQRWVRRNPGGS